MVPSPSGELSVPVAAVDAEIGPHGVDPLAYLAAHARALLRVARERSAEAVRDLDTLRLGLAAASLVAMLVTVRFHWMALFPLVYVTLMVTGRAVRERHWRMATLMLLFLHTAVQIPGYMKWLRRKPRASAARMARDVSRRINLATTGDEPVVVMGGLSPFVSLFNKRVRPIGFKWIEDLPACVDQWRPRYLLAFPKAADGLRKRCPALVAELEFVASYRVMDNYYVPEDQALYRIVYVE